MAWAKNGTPNTLGSAVDDIDITDLTAKKFNVFLTHSITSSTTSQNFTFNNNSNSVYAIRKSANGGADSTSTSQALWDSFSNGVQDVFILMYVVSISGEEKLGIMFEIRGATTGAGTAPNRIEWVGKFVPSPDAHITRIDMNNPDAGDYATGSNISALGTD